MRRTAQESRGSVHKTIRFAFLCLYILKIDKDIYSYRRLENRLIFKVVSELYLQQH